MLDRRRIITKIDELDGYLAELREVMPDDLKQYGRIEKKRSCERLLQLCIECVIDICRIIVSGMRLGLPSDENDLFVKLQKKRVVTPSMGDILRGMRGFRNILVHEYASVDDEVVFTFVKKRLGDFENFKKLVLKALKKM